MPNPWTGKGNPYTRKEVRERLMDTIKKGDAVIAAGAGAGIGIGLIGFAAAQAVGRNPGAFGNILTISIIGMALAEAIAIYALVLAFAQGR